MNTWKDFKCPINVEVGNLTLTSSLGVVIIIWLLFLFNTVLWGIVGLIEAVSYFLGMF